MSEDYQILRNVLFKCIICLKILNCKEIYTYLKDNISQIRKESENSIGYMILDDQYVEDPYEYPIYGKKEFKCPQCGKELEIKIILSAYDKELCSFYDIKGVIPFFPFQVLMGENIKELILELIFRWIHIAKRIDVVTPYLDQFGYDFLSKLPSFIYYYDDKSFINIITRKGKKATKKKNGKIIYGETGKVLLDRLFEEENCKTCRANNPIILYGDCLGCIKLSNHLKLKIPNISRSHFHAKWYAGIIGNTVEILITSHNLTKIGKHQPETVGLLIMDTIDYEKKFLSKLKI